MATTNTVNQNSIPDESIQEIISETEICPVGVVIL